MATVYRRPGEPFEKMYQRFANLVYSERIIHTYKRKMYYMKPSEKRKYKEWKRIRKLIKKKKRLFEKLGLFKKGKKRIKV